MADWLRVTDDVTPRREYSIAAISYVPGVHTILEKDALALDGTVLPPKYTPEALAGAPEVPPTEGPGLYDGLHVADLEAEIEKRNDGRPEDEQISKAGKKADLIAALEADDARVGEAPPEAPESLSS